MTDLLWDLWTAILDYLDPPRRPDPGPQSGLDADRRAYRPPADPDEPGC